MSRILLRVFVSFASLRLLEHMGLRVFFEPWSRKGLQEDLNLGGGGVALGGLGI